jgi:hypothetical protein
LVKHPLVTHIAQIRLAFLVASALCACAGRSSSSAWQTVDADAGYQTGFQGDGVQCGAIVCSGAQQCCLVYVPTDASSSNPTHACDQNCISICADTCPDAGGATGTGMPPAGGGGMPMGGMSAEGGMGMGGKMPPMMVGPGDAEAGGP